VYFDEAPKSRLEDLYDFKTQVEQLRTAIRRRNRMIVILGLRRTGKTSLLQSCLNAEKVPYLLLDGRVFAGRPLITYEELLRHFEISLNQALRASLPRKFLNALKGLRGVEISVGQLRVSLKWAPRAEAASPFEIVESLARSGRLVLAIDEAQEFGKLAGFDLTGPLAHIYDYVPNVQVVVTGSKVGLLRDFLGEEDADAYLYGRFKVEIGLSYLDERESMEFLEKGAEQAGLKIPQDLQEKVVREMNGVIGWLTFFGAKCRAAGKADEQVLKRAVEEAARMATKEFEHFLVGREAAARRYRILVRKLSEPANWRQLKEALERTEGRSVPGKTVSTLLQKLIDAGFVQKGDDQYSLADPMLRRASIMGLV
jgi:AAA+ ATPase superfamily predicted ATPase